MQNYQNGYIKISFPNQLRFSDFRLRTFFPNNFLPFAVNFIIFVLLRKDILRFIKSLKTKHYGIQYQKQEFFEIVGFHSQRDKIHARPGSRS